MKRLNGVLAGLALLLLAVLMNGPPQTIADEEGEQELVLMQVPAAVKAAARAAVEGIELEEAEVEAVLIYELEGKANGTEYEIELTAEGKILEIEKKEQAEDNACDDEGDKQGEEENENEDEEEAEHELDIPVSAVPESVRKAAAAAVEGIEFSEAEVESVLVYELEGEVKEREYEIEVTADGKVIEVEEEEE